MQKPLYSVSISDAFRILTSYAMGAIDKNTTPKNVFLHGTMGLGKSTIVQDLAEFIKKSTDVYTDVEVID